MPCLCLGEQMFKVLLFRICHGSVHSPCPLLSTQTTVDLLLIWTDFPLVLKIVDFNSQFQKKNIFYSLFLFLLDEFQEDKRENIDLISSYFK